MRQTYLCKRQLLRQRGELIVLQRLAITPKVRCRNKVADLIGAQVVL